MYGPGPFMFYQDHLCFGISGPGGPFVTTQMVRGTIYVEHKWSPRTTYARTIYVVTVHI